MNPAQQERHRLALDAELVARINATIGNYLRLPTPGTGFAAWRRVR